jgi:hypothetical protein
MAGLGDLLGGFLPQGGGAGGGRSAADYQRLAQAFQQLGAQGGSPVINPWVQGIAGLASGIGQSWAGGKADEMESKRQSDEKAKIAELLVGTGIDPKIAAEIGIDDAVSIYKATKDGSASFNGAKQVYNPETGMTEWFAPGTDLHGKTVGASNYGRLGKGGRGSKGGGGGGAASADGWSPDAPGKPAEALAAALTGAPASVPRPPRPDLAAAAGVSNPAAEGAPSAPQAAAQPGPSSMPRRETDRPIEADQAVQPDGQPGRFAAPAAPSLVDALAPGQQQEPTGINALQQDIVSGVASMFESKPTGPIQEDRMPDAKTIRESEPGTVYTYRDGDRGIVEAEVVIVNGEKQLKKKAR